MKIYKNSRNALYIILIINLLCFVLPEPILFLLKKNKEIWFDFVGLSHDFSFFKQNVIGLFTYGFFHIDFFHFLTNILFLYIFGELFFDYFRRKIFLKTYFLGIIFSGLFFVFAYHFFPVFEGKKSTLLGASGGVISVVVFLCCYYPKNKIKLWRKISVSFWFLAFVLVILDIVSIPFSNTGGRLAHLGGALFGFLYAWFYKNQIYGKAKNQILKIERKNIFKKNTKKTKKSQNKSLISEEDQKREEKINLILKKISRSGYDSLSSEEKKFLFEISKNREF